MPRTATLLTGAYSVRVSSPAPPQHRRPALLVLVAAGGATGSVLRFLLSAAVPDLGSWPVATLLVNLVGAFLLGLLLEALNGPFPEPPRRRAVRLALGTGLLGGFTTYSTFAAESGRLLLAGDVLVGAAYAVGSVVLGLAVALVGVRFGSMLGRSREASA